MKNRIREKIFVRVLVAALLLIAPSTLCGQQTGKQSSRTLAKEAPWLGKDALRKLTYIAEWQQEKESRYSAALRERNSLKTFANGTEQEETQCPPLHNPSPMQHLDRSQLYNICSRCDTAIIRLYKDLCGDDELKKLCDALLLLHKYEGVLQKPYNSSEVSRAREAIKPGKEVAPDVYDDIDRRLEQYAAMNENLRLSLSKADSASATAYSKERGTERFFTTLEKHLDPVDANAYPYLYGILQEAIAVKMSDPSNNIQNLIDKL